MTEHRVNLRRPDPEEVTLEDVMTEVRRTAQLLENIDTKLSKIEKSFGEIKGDISELRDQLDQ